jgi:hypothetical protein
MVMGRPISAQDGDDLMRKIHGRNQVCSRQLLDLLIAEHGHEFPEVATPEPLELEEEEETALPPIPNKVIERAAEIAFPNFAFPTTGRITAIKRATLTEYPGITLNDLTSQRRTMRTVFARQVAMYLAKKLTPNSLPEIGRRFGGRDHTTVLHAVRKIEHLVGADPVLAAQIERIAAIIPEGAP